MLNTFVRAFIRWPLDKLSAKINSVKSYAVSDEGAEVAVVLDAKHVGELALLLSVDCLNDLLSTLNRAKVAIEGKRAKQINARQDNNPKQDNQVTISVPKNWLVSADTKVHNVVLLVFNHQTDIQSGYALDPDAAKKMATGLVKNADAVLTSKGNQRANPGKGAGP